MVRTAFNTTESPVVIDDDGRSLAGMSRGDVDTDSPAVQLAVQTGQLVYPEIPQPEQHPQADSAPAPTPKAVEK